MKALSANFRKGVDIHMGLVSQTVVAGLPDLVNGRSLTAYSVGVRGFAWVNHLYSRLRTFFACQWARGMFLDSYLLDLASWYSLSGIASGARALPLD